MGDYRLKAAVLVPLVAGGLLAGCSGGGNDAAAAADSKPQATVTVTATATATVPGPAVTFTVTPAVTVTAPPPPPETAFSDGVWLVGTDIKAGRYRTKDVVTDGCYWEIDRAAGSDEIVQNDNVSGGRPTVVLKAGQEFTSNRCGDWVKG